MLAISGITIRFPEMLLASPRTHNQIVREELDTELRVHHRLIMPGHFLPSAAAKYGHAKRTRAYIDYKVRFYGTGTDLVRTGETKTEILNNRDIVISGAAAADTLRGRLTMRLPFGGGTGREFDDEAYANIEAALARGTDKQGRPLTSSQRAWIIRKLQNRNSNRGKVGVTPAQIIRELRTVTQDEADAATRRMGQGYVNKIKAMAKPRLAAGVTRAMLN